MAVKGRLSDHILAKVDRVTAILQEYDSVAIAFSGGVDSTVLLHICSNHFSRDNVTAYFVNSCLQSATARDNVKHIIDSHFSRSSAFTRVEHNLSTMSEVVKNSTQRCYHCKKSCYTILLDLMKIRGQQVLFDGTNVDDLQEERPGLKAAKELGVRSPLLEGGFTKNDIREYARCMKLKNADLPSNSCLATRIDTGSPITPEALRKVEEAELFLDSMGFKGVRVRLREYGVCLEFQENDISRVVSINTRHEIIEFFRSSGLGPVYIGLSGR